MGGKGGGRDQRVKNSEQERGSVSRRGFFCLPCGLWLDLHTGFRRVSMFVCVWCKREGLCRHRAGGDRSESNRTQTCKQSWDTERHSHS